MSGEMNTLFQALGILFMLWVALELIPFGKRTRVSKNVGKGATR